MAMKICTIHIPNQYLECIQIMQDLGYFPSRSEAIRQALKIFLSKETKLIKDMDPENFREIKEIQMNVLIGGK